MTYGAAPSFVDGTVLSARQINQLDGGLDHLYGVGKGVSIPTAYISDTDAAGLPDPTPVFDGYICHRHGTNEYLYYDIQITNEAGSETVTCDIYYEAVIEGTDTPLATITTTSTERKRGLVSLTDFPTEGTHPANEDLVPVKVFATRSASEEPCKVEVFMLQEILLPTTYTALNDAAALTDDQVTDVAADLQAVSDNYVALDAISLSDVPGFRCIQSNSINLGMGKVSLGRWYFNTHKTGRLYYRVGLAKDNSGTGTGHKTTVTFRLNSNPATDTTVEWSGFYRDVSDPEIFEGYIDLTSYLGSWEYQGRVRVNVYVEYGSNDGFGRAILYYLGEYGVSTDSDWKDLASYSHSDYVIGDGGADSVNLRSLWDNCLLLADDDGTGYRSNEDMSGDGNYPCGYAIAVCRSPVIHRGFRHNVIPKGRYILINYERDMNAQQMAIRRTKDFLYYRTKNASLIFIGDDGEENTHPLEDYDDDNDYHILDLNSIQGLSVGMWYSLRALVPVGGDDGGEVLDWASERDIA